IGQCSPDVYVVATARSSGLKFAAAHLAIANSGCWVLSPEATRFRSSKSTSPSALTRMVPKGSSPASSASRASSTQRCKNGRSSAAIEFSVIQSIQSSKSTRHRLVQVIPQALISGNPALWAPRRRAPRRLIISCLNTSPDFFISLLPQRFRPFTTITVCERNHRVITRDPQVGATHSEVPRSISRHISSHPVGILLSMDLKTQPPWARPMHAITRHNTAQIRKLNSAHLRQGIRMNNLRIKHFRSKFHQVIHARNKPMPSASLKTGGIHAQRLQQSFIKIFLKGHTCSFRNNLRRPFIPSRRINTTIPYRT